MQQQDTNPVSDLSEKRRSESVKIISLLSALGAWVGTAVTVYLLLEDPHYSILTFVSAIMASCLTIANFLAHRNKLNPAIWLSIFTIEIFLIAISFIVANLGIILAIILLISIGNLVLQSLSSKAAIVAISTGVVTSIITLLVDVLSLNPAHIIAEDGTIKIAVIVAGLIILILGMELLSYYRFNSIRSQIIVAFIIISAVPLWTIIIPQLIGNNSSTEIRVTILIATILMLAALAVAIIASNQLTSPINYLISVSEQIRQGRLNFPIALERSDEIGQLSKTLNTTTLELREILATIENKVDERTADLSTATKNAEQRATQLHSIIKIIRTISSIQNINELFSEIAQQISTIFDFYHVGIFLTDQAGEYTVLKAANSKAGQKMLEKGYRVKVGQTDSISFVISSGQIHITSNIGHEGTVFSAPDLPDTRSRIILPLQIDEIIIGALDLQSDVDIIFDKDIINVFNLLTSQISIIIQNAQLFTETRDALAEAQVFYRQSATASWRDVLHQGTRGYRYLNGNVEAIKVIEETYEKTTRQNTQNNPEKQSSHSDQESLLIPINIRGKSLGTLNIHQVGRNHPWSNAEIRVYKSIVDRISFALENARLYQDAQKRAAKERVISEIATKVSSSVNMDNILQTAVEELGRVLPGSEIVIQFEHEEDETSSEFREQE